MVKLVYLFKVEKARPREEREGDVGRQRRAKRLLAREAREEDEEKKKKAERRLDVLCR